MINASNIEGLYFIAIIPSEPVYSDAQDWKNHFANKYQSKAALNSPPHITLHMPFKWKVQKEKTLIDVLKIATATKSFNLKIDGFDGFAPRVVFMNVLENIVLQQLQEKIQEVMKTQLNIFNAAYRNHPFHPHLTLAFRDLKKDKFEQAWNEFKSKTYEQEFLVTQFSLLKHDGKRWELITNYELR